MWPRKRSKDYVSSSIHIMEVGQVVLLGAIIISVCAVIWTWIFSDSVYYESLFGQNASPTEDSKRRIEAAKDASAVAQGTLGIATNFLSLILVAMSTLQIAKGNVLMRIEAQRERGRRKLDQLLSHRDHVAEHLTGLLPGEGRAESHARSYRSRIKAYVKIDPANELESMRTSLVDVGDILQNDQYIKYMQHIFQQAELSSSGEKSLMSDFIEYIWINISIEERLICILSAFLGAKGIRLPSIDNVLIWATAIELDQPWGQSTIKLVDIYNNLASSQDIAPWYKRIDALASQFRVFR